MEEGQNKGEKKMKNLKERKAMKAWSCTRKGCKKTIKAGSNYRRWIDAGVHRECLDHPAPKAAPATKKVAAKKTKKKAAKKGGKK